MTNHTNNNPTTRKPHQHQPKNNHHIIHRSNTNTNKHKHKHLSLQNLNIPSSSDTSVSTSYYSSDSLGSLSPLSINSNSYTSLPPIHTCTSKNKYHNYRKHHFTDKQSAKFSLQVFVAMHTTRQLAWYIQHEPWGDKNSLLFKYLDYTFRCAAFRDEIYSFECNNNDENTADKMDNVYNTRLVFNTGLIARQSGTIIYLILTPNQKKSVAQQWRVGYGDPYSRYNSSFVTDTWLLNNVLQQKKELLPKKFILNHQLFYQIKHKFHKNKLQIEADFEHIVTKYWDRIIGEYNKRSSVLHIPTKQETIKLLKKAFDFVRKDKKKHELLTPMLYVDSHNTQHSVEYMVPLAIHIPMRNHKNKHETIYFAAALVSRERNHAQLMSILSADMAYSNARLIGGVRTPWLKKLAPVYHKLESQLSSKIRPILRVYHIDCGEDDIERYLYTLFNKYGVIVRIEVSLVHSPNENDLNPSDKFSACVTFNNSYCVIDAYNATMDALNRGCKVGFELDFELIKEISMEENNGDDNNGNVSGKILNCNTCQFSMIFSRAHILPPPDQLLSLSTNDIGPFYPIHRINHECAHCHNNDNVSHDTNGTNVIASNVSSRKKYQKYNHKSVRVSVINNNHKNYRVLYRNEREYINLCDLLMKYGVNVSYIKCINSCMNNNNNVKRINNNNNNNDTILWYRTSPSLANQIASHGFIFKFMTDFSQSMDTSGFKFGAKPSIKSNYTSIHLFQCRLRLTDKQLGYLRHNGSIIITDTRIITPNYWIVLAKK